MPSSSRSRRTLAEAQPDIDPTLPAAWREWRSRVDLDEYEERWNRLAASGQHPHGEADLVEAYAPRTVLDAGCGMGRVAIELAARGMDVVGVDVDREMLERAQRRAPDLEWHVADLTDLDDVLGARRFDVVVLAGNVVPFIDPGRRARAIAACARHVAADGHLIAGGKLERNWPSTVDYDRWCADAGLVLADRWSTWEREPFVEGDSDYAVSVHRPA